MKGPFLLGRYLHRQCGTVPAFQQKLRRFGISFTLDDCEYWACEFRKLRYSPRDKAADRNLLRAAGYLKYLGLQRCCASMDDPFLLMSVGKLALAACYLTDSVCSS